MDGFVTRSKNNRYILNVSETKEMIVDFRRARNKNAKECKSLGKRGEVGEKLQTCWIYQDIKQDWGLNTEAFLWDAQVLQCCGICIPSIGLLENESLFAFICGSSQ